MAGYFCAIGIALIFMFFMDGRIGVMMLSFLVLMPLLSLIVTLIARRSLRVRLVLPDSAAKHQDVPAVIVLEKDTPVPVPFLRLRLHADAHFGALNPNAAPLPEKPVQGIGAAAAMRYRNEMNRWKKMRKSQLTPDMIPFCLSMGTSRKEEYRILLHPRFCGGGEVVLKELVLSDYLGMFSFRLHTEPRETVLITPEIPEMKANSELFRSVSTAVAAADEETDSTPTHSASAMPGYEHREYVAGDSLKRINWKLSSKRHHLMVRQDEPVALARLSVVLDFRRSPKNIPMIQQLGAEEQLIESSLGFLMLCAKYGYPCKLSYADVNGEWSSLSLDDAEQLAVEAVNLLRGGFRSPEALAGIPMLPPDLQQDGGAVLLYFTTDASPELIGALEQYPSTLYLAAPEQLSAGFAVPKNGSLWLITHDPRLIQAGGEN